MRHQLHRAAVGRLQLALDRRQGVAAAAGQAVLNVSCVLDEVNPEIRLTSPTLEEALEVPSVASPHLPLCSFEEPKLRAPTVQLEVDEVAVTARVTDPPHISRASVATPIDWRTCKRVRRWVTAI